MSLIMKHEQAHRTSHYCRDTPLSLDSPAEELFLNAQEHSLQYGMDVTCIRSVGWQYSVTSAQARHGEDN